MVASEQHSMVARFHDVIIVDDGDVIKHRHGFSPASSIVACACRLGRRNGSFNARSEVDVGYQAAHSTPSEQCAERHTP
jgi:hypothetical protein